MEKSLQKAAKISFVLGLAFWWLFSGWPPIWQKPRIPPEIPEAQAATTPNFEAGEVTISDSLSWTSITLNGTYTSAPVIIATPVTSNNCAGTCSGTSVGNGGMYPIPVVRNVTTSGFDISMCVDGGATACSTGMSAENFHWFAFDVDDAGNYSWIETGTTTNVAVDGSATAATYSTSFVNTPDVWTQAQTYSQSGNIGAHAWVNPKSASGFSYVGCTHQGTGDSCTGGTNETFGYVAIDTTSEAFDAGSNFQTGMANISSSAWTAATFSSTYTNPRVMVTQNSENGGQDPQYAWAQSVTGSGMNFRYCEEDAGDECNSHNGEDVYWFAVEDPVVGPVTDQLHFRWRDDTTDLNTSSGWLAVEDSNSISDITKNDTYRLRVESARTNGAEASARTYELQWGEKTGQSSCAGISTWTGIANASDEFAMVDSANISPDGESATPGLLANSEGYTFNAGEGRDIADTTGSIGPLSASNYTELEYSFQATDKAVTGHSYCFRLYDTTAASALDSYSAYPEATVSSVTISKIGMEWGTQTNVSDDGWSTINFSGSYTNPVFVCTVQYANNIGNESDGDADATVCRTQNVGATSAQVRVQEPGAPGSLTQNETVHWIVVEEGEYDTGNIKLEAFTYNSTVTDSDSSWVGEAQSYTQSYTNPVVIGQVMTYNDPDYSVFWAHNNSNGGSGASGAPDSSTLYTGKHVAEDSDTVRADETIGVIVFEQGNGTLDGTDFEVRLQGQTIDRIDDAPPTSYTFSQSFSTTPTVAVISLAGISGTNGGHPVLYGASPLSTTQIDLAIDEEEIGDTEMGGNTEYVPYIAFESAGTAVIKQIAYDQTTYRFYDNTDSVQPTTAKAAENTAITGVADTDIVRIRTAVQVGLNDLAASSQAFKLQYGQGSNCSAIGTWTDVGGVGSGGVWRGYGNATPADGDTITSSLLNSQSNVLESYEEENNSVSNPNQIFKGSRGEWDWVVENNGASGGVDYCFRTVLADGTVMQYTNYPKLTTSSVVSISITSDGVIDYGTMPLNSSKSTLTGELNDLQTVQNTGNVVIDLNIKGQDSVNWVLSSSSGSDQYVHKFCNQTNNDCSSPPTSYTALNTGYQSFDSGILANGTADFHLQITTPSSSSVDTQQSVDVTIQAVGQ